MNGHSGKSGYSTRNKTGAVKRKRYQDCDSDEHDFPPKRRGRRKRCAATRSSPRKLDNGHHNYNDDTEEEEEEEESGSDTETDDESVESDSDTPKRGRKRGRPRKRKRGTSEEEDEESTAESTSSDSEDEDDDDDGASDEDRGDSSSGTEEEVATGSATRKRGKHSDNQSVRRTSQRPKRSPTILDHYACKNPRPKRTTRNQGRRTVTYTEKNSDEESQLVRDAPADVDSDATDDYSETEHTPETVSSRGRVRKMTPKARARLINS